MVTKISNIAGTNGPTGKDRDMIKLIRLMLLSFRKGDTIKLIRLMLLSFRKGQLLLDRHRPDRKWNMS